MLASTFEVFGRAERVRAARAQEERPVESGGSGRRAESCASTSGDASESESRAAAPQRRFKSSRAPAILSSASSLCQTHSRRHHCVPFPLCTCTCSYRRSVIMRHFFGHIQFRHSCAGGVKVRSSHLCDDLRQLKQFISARCRDMSWHALGALWMLNIACHLHLKIPFNILSSGPSVCLKILFTLSLCLKIP